MFCTDDCHPDDLELGHINLIVKKAIDLGYDFWDILAAATVNPVRHYRLNVGLLKPGDPADFIVIDSPLSFNVLSTWVDGQLRWDGSVSKTNSDKPTSVNFFERSLTHESMYRIQCQVDKSEINVIEALDGSLITRKKVVNAKIVDGYVVSDTDNDILKIAVINRYADQPIALGFIHGFALSEGAIASSVAHDSHNIVCIGVDDYSIMSAVNLVIKEKGGIACVLSNETAVLPLPVAGLMSTESGEVVALQYKKLNSMAISAGSVLRAPFMTLSFMALLVIPEFKIGDKGLFDGIRFKPDSLFTSL
jgi:adenine deaminase